MFVALLIIGSSIPLVPWTVRNFQVYGSLVAVEPRLAKHLHIARGSHSGLSEQGTDGVMDRGMIMAGRFASEFLHFWKLYPDRVAMSQPGLRDRIHEKDQRVVQSTIFSPSTLINLVSILSTGPLFFFALIGTVTMGLCKARRRELTMLWTIILSFAVGYSFFFTQTRYRIPIEPYITILSAYGLVQSWLFLRSYGWRRLTVSRDKVEKTITAAKP
jgi:hypothetical protein